VWEARAASNGSTVANDWDHYVDQFVAKYFELNPGQAVNAGLHQYDGVLPDLSADAVAAQLAWLKQERDRLVAWDLTKAPETSRFERDYLLFAIDRVRFQLEVSEFLYTNPTLYGGIIGPDVYLTREYAPLPDRMRAFIKYEKALPAFLATMRSNLRTPLARPRLEVAKGIFDGYVTFFRDTVPGLFVSVDDAALQNELKESNATAIGAFSEARDWLTAQLDSATNDYALGADRFLQMLRMSEGVEITLDELRAAGKHDLDRNLDALSSAFTALRPPGTRARRAAPSRPARWSRRRRGTSCGDRRRASSARPAPSACARTA